MNFDKINDSQFRLKFFSFLNPKSLSILCLISQNYDITDNIFPNNLACQTSFTNSIFLFLIFLFYFWSLPFINQFLYLEYTIHTKFLKKCQQNIHSLSVFFCCCYLRKCGVTWISTRRHQNKLLWGRCDLLITVI